MNGARTTVLIDPLSGNAYHSKSKKLAEVIAKDCRDRLKIKGTFVLPFIEAIKLMAALDGVDLKPPYNLESITLQLQHGAKTGAQKNRKKAIALKNKHTITKPTFKLDTASDRYKL